jgi:hypothetical protein
LAEGFFPAEHCSAETQVSKNHADLNQMDFGHSNGHPRERTDSHNHDCSCPVHGLGCAHISAGVLAPEEKWFDHLLQSGVSRMAFTIRDQMNKKGPYLDEPFQPPRA